MKYLILIYLFFLGATAFSSQIMLEGGAVWQQRNDVQITPQAGTFVEFDQFDKGPFFHYRLEGDVEINDSHALRFVYAPFNVRVTGQVPTTVNFNDIAFAANTDLTVDYTFNSYRLSWVYGFWGFGDERLSMGLTGKVREAKIVFEQGSQKKSYSNIGFVPLLFFELQKSLGGDWLFHFNTDAAGASQGRAIDVAIKLRKKLSESYQIGVGGRTLEGGADNEKVFTFSWFNYAVVDLVGTF